LQLADGSLIRFNQGLHIHLSELFLFVTTVIDGKLKGKNNYEH